MHFFVLMESCCIQAEVRKLLLGWFSPCTMLVPGTKLGSSGLAACALTHWTTSLALVVKIPGYWGFPGCSSQKTEPTADSVFGFVPFQRMRNNCFAPLFSPNVGAAPDCSKGLLIILTTELGPREEQQYQLVELASLIWMVTCFSLGILLSMLHPCSIYQTDESQYHSVTMRPSGMIQKLD